MYLPLNRIHSKKLALVLIVVGLILSPDILFPTIGTDIILNIPMAMILADLADTTLFVGLMATYTFAFLLILVGLLIYPYNTKRLMIGKAKTACMFVRSNPLMFIAAIVILAIIFWFGSEFYDTYYQTVKDHAIQILGGI